MIVVTVEHRVVQQFHLLLLLIWSIICTVPIVVLLLFLLCMVLITIIHRRRVWSLTLTHIIFHQSLSESIVGLPTNDFKLFSGTATIQRITYGLVYHLLFFLLKISEHILSIVCLFFLIRTWIHRICLHFDILLDLVIILVLSVVQIVLVQSLLDAFMIVRSVQKLTVRYCWKFLRQFNVLRFAVVVTLTVEGFVYWLVQLVVRFKLSCVRALSYVRFILKRVYFACLRTFRDIHAPRV